MKVVPNRIKIQIIAKDTPYELSVAIEAFLQQNIIQEVYDIKYQHSISEVGGNDIGVYSDDLFSAMIIYEERDFGGISDEHI